MTGASTLDWLRDSDPALRWQVERDLDGAGPEVWRATRARIATEGWGARLLALQDPSDGQWAGGAFFPAEPTTVAGQPWTATTWTLNTLREWGLDAAVLHQRRTVELLAEHCRWEYQDLPYWGGEVDCCINAWTLANGAWLGAEVASIADWFVDHQLDDGGWNCDWVDGASRSSFHSTLNALTGLLAYEAASGGSAASRDARHRGEEYLLRRHLHRRASTGEQVGPWTCLLAYPFRWRYNVLRATDHFRRAATLEGRPADERIGEAVDLIRGQRQPDGTWIQGEREPGQVWFETDAAEGRPSRWLTLYATRVLDWWDGGAADRQPR